MANEQLFDVRILERNLQKGLITQEEYEKHLADLDDAEENAAVIEAEFVEGVLDEDEDEEGEEEEEEEEAEESDDDTDEAE
jgi:hypothetical protein